jgi:hypothetical protein
LQDLVDLLSLVSFDTGAALQAPSTPQNNALLWLSNNINLDAYSDEKRIQRYALATFFYSTNGDNWKRNAGWITDVDECDWYNRANNLLCVDGSVVQLEFCDRSTKSGNHVIGTIPNELTLLSDSLGKFNFGIVCFGIPMERL